MAIGLFLSRDNGTISKAVDVDTLAARYSDLEVAKVYDSFFDARSLQDMLGLIEG